MSITFEQVANITNVHRSIARLQDQLNNQKGLMTFAVARDTAGQRKWEELSSIQCEAARDVLCKVTVVEILGLLDEAQRLGVDVTKSKEALAEFLATLKQPEPTP